MSGFGMKNHTQDVTRNWTVAQFRSALDHTLTAFMMVDRDFVIRYANTATRRLMKEHEAAFQEIWPQFDAGEIIGISVDHFHAHPEHQRSLLADPANLPYRTDIRVGSLTFHLQVSGQFDADGNIVGYTLEWRDVTDVRAKERQNEDYQRQVEACSRTLSVVNLSMDGTVLDANAKFLNALGYSLDEIRGKSRGDLLPSWSEASAWHDDWTRLEHGEFVEGEIEHRSKDGRSVWFQATLLPILDDDGRPIRITQFATDITVSVQQRNRVEKGVEDVLKVMDAAASGDLTQQVDIHGSDAIGKLGRGVSALLSDLRKSLLMVDASVLELKRESDRLDGLSEGLGTHVQSTVDRSRRAKSDSSEVDGHIQSVSAATRQMSASISEISSSASNAANVAQSAVQTASEVRSTVENLGASSVEIGKVIKVINSIAEQTNLLALNATIEAARAGEAGRGFAVVANEVKELAKGTATATKDIGQKVSAIRAATRETIDAIQKVGAIIEEISEYQHTIASAVEEQSATTKEIERSVTEAATRSREIVGSLESMQKTSESASEDSTQVRSAAAQLSRLATNLEGMLGRFRIRGRRGPPPSRSGAQAGLGRAGGHGSAQAEALDH
jgi:methyl-accepting chemotaxis protein